MSRFVAYSSERGTATILEYTIVLPIVILVVLLLIILGNLTYEKALLESAAERGALYACKVVADPNYGNQEMFPKKANLNEVGEIAMNGDKIVTVPYRYLAGLFRTPTVQIEDDITQLVRDGQLIRGGVLDAPKVVVTSGLAYKVSVTVSEKFEIPGMFKYLGVPAFAEITATSEMYVNQPAEFIRNADYAVELTKKAAAALGITDRINSIKSSIRFFFDRTKE